jgi:hypothetical protein
MQDFLVFPTIYAQKINLKSKSLNEQFPHLTYLDLVYGYSYCQKEIKPVLWVQLLSEKDTIKYITSGK